MKIKCIMAIVLGFTFACGASSREFRPAERATAESPTGYEAAAYTIVVDGQRIGEAKVWSRGAYEADDEMGDRTIIHFGLEIENHTDVPLILVRDEFRLTGITEDSIRFSGITPVRVDGSLRIVPGATQQVDLFFQLRGEELEPNDIGGLGLHWMIQDGGRYAQYTPFVRDQRIYAGTVRWYYSPFYDPIHYYYPYRTIIVTRPYRHTHRYYRHRMHRR